LNRAFNKTRRAVMRELPAAAAAAAAALQKNLQVAEFLPLLHCARRSGMVFIFVYDINTHTYTVFNARRTANSHIYYMRT
jgi:hypothetical protein